MCRHLVDDRMNKSGAPKSPEQAAASNELSTRLKACFTSHVRVQVHFKLKRIRIRQVPKDFENLLPHPFDERTTVRIQIRSLECLS